MKLNLKAKISKIWSQIKTGIVFKRDSEVVIDKASFYITLAVSGLCIGLLWGIASIILSANCTQDTMDTVVSVVVSILMVLGLVWDIYLIFPIFTDTAQPLWIKIVRPIVGVLSYAVSFMTGLYALVMIVILIILSIAGALLYLVLKLLGIIEEVEYEESKLDRVVLDDGTELRRTGINEYEGNDGRRYERTSNDTFRQV